MINEKKILSHLEELGFIDVASTYGTGFALQIEKEKGAELQKKFFDFLNTMGKYSIETIKHPHGQHQDKKTNVFIPEYSDWPIVRMFITESKESIWFTVDLF